MGSPKQSKATTPALASEERHPLRAQGMEKNQTIKTAVYPLAPEMNKTLYRPHFQHPGLRKRLIT